MPNDFKERNEFLHEFFIAGGRICLRPKGEHEVDIPDAWYDQADYQEMKRKALHLALEMNDFPSYAVADVTEQLQMPYKQVLRLIRYQRLGTIKVSGVYQIYQPSVEEYLRWASMRKPWEAII